MNYRYSAFVIDISSLLQGLTICQTKFSQTSLGIAIGAADGFKINCNYGIYAIPVGIDVFMFLNIIFIWMCWARNAEL